MKEVINVSKQSPDKNYAFAILSIIAIVAIVGLVVLIKAPRAMHVAEATANTDNIGGEAYQSKGVYTSQGVYLPPELVSAMIRIYGQIVLDDIWYDCGSAGLLNCACSDPGCQGSGCTEYTRFCDESSSS